MLIALHIFFFLMSGNSGDTSLGESEIISHIWKSLIFDCIIHLAVGMLDSISNPYKSQGNILKC